MGSTNRTSYDEVPYESHPFPQTHIDRLATVATLLGLRPVPVTRCRVLELGTAAGGNLLPMAVAFPDSTFLGIDLSAVQVAEGNETVRSLGLKNIELKRLSIMDVGPDLGKFDYIICHGVYSWVPNEVQDKILEVNRENLSPNGIGYVSYNTYPGWHMRGMIRDMLSYHARQFVEPQTRIHQARNLLDFLGKAAGSENTPYGLLLKQELEAIRGSSDSYLFHEHLEDVNEPTYFYQFAERAKAHGLKYVAEVDLRVMVASNFPPEIANVLNMLSHDLIHLEQYMDFIRNRMFRQTLLCHKNLNPNYNLRADQLTPFHVASAAKPANPKPDLNSANVEKFETPDGVTLNSSDPLVKSAMVCLSEIWPQTIPFKTLVKQARERLENKDAKAAEKDVEILGQAFLTFYVSGSTSLLELHLEPPRFCPKVSERPEASPLARLQAPTSNRVTNLRHESVYLGDIERQILKNLDGSHDRAALIRVLTELVANGELMVEKDGESVTNADQVRDIVANALDKQLPTIARNALLIK
jgi:methyltransferase-like protein/2-polyprenyl-3-methyl-5-hydroxy-6-metoxy-1,4-benzoquinol methylase